MGNDTLSGIEHLNATYWTIRQRQRRANWIFATAGNDYVAGL